MDLGEPVRPVDQRPQLLPIAQDGVHLALGELTRLVHRLQVQGIVHRQGQDVVDLEQREQAVPLRDGAGHELRVGEARLEVVQVRRTGASQMPALTSATSRPLMVSVEIRASTRSTWCSIRVSPRGPRAPRRVTRAFLQERLFQKDILVMHPPLPVPAGVGFYGGGGVACLLEQDHAVPDVRDRRTPGSAKETPMKYTGSSLVICTRRTLTRCSSATSRIGEPSGFAYPRAWDRTPSDGPSHTAGARTRCT